MKKSKAKAIGLKSVLVTTKGEVLVTSFGKKAEATIEKKIINNKVDKEHDPPTFSLNVDNYDYRLKNNTGTFSAEVENPFPKKESNRKIRWKNWQEGKKEKGEIPTIKRTIGDDQIFAKAELETEFFGKRYEDNIHIQIIYNILDIRKILSPYINDIIYSINNLNRDLDVDDEKSDIFTIRFSENYEKASDRIKNLFEKFYNSISKNGYYSTVFYHQEGDKFKFKSKIEIFDIFRLLSAIRQDAMHSSIRNKNCEYNVFFDEKMLPNDLKVVLDGLYSQKVYETNKSFIELNKRANFSILDNLYPDEKNKEALYRLFYDFNVRQENLNLGFSIKRIRECLLTITDYSEIKNKDFDSERSKLYHFFDFALYKYYLSNNKIVDIFVEKLRQNMTEEGKDELYVEQANEVAKILHDEVIDRLLPMMNGDVIKQLNSDSSKSKITDEIIQRIRINDSVTYFTKLLYFMTLFLDDKETNDMLANITNKFDNIESFIQVYKNKDNEILDDGLSDLQNMYKGHKLKKDNPQIVFSGKYALFNKNNEIANELRILKSISRFKPAAFITRQMILDAAYLLGYKEDQNSDQVLTKKLKLDDEGSKGARNFLINNVVKSRRFIYIARHVNPRKICVVAQNEHVVRLVLERLPLEQLTRYYQAITGLDLKAPPKMIDKLVQEIKSVNLESFIDIDNKALSRDKQIIKEQKKTIIGLYLTVLYLVYKNLVNVNSRYAIAIHTLERDYDIKFSNEEFDFKKLDNQLKLSNLFIEKGYLKKKQREILQKNISGLSNGRFFSFYRNQIAHLNTIRNLDKYISNVKDIKTYFGLYHFISQALLCAKIMEHCKGDNSFLFNSIKESQRRGKYSKDALHIIHVPFGYNQARYKNLSIEVLFDKNK
ncbi:MAG TPA: type VI-D CRISPR-associated RNA-guided ribonuclease Cas13d [Bacilli bacterium]|nr:type VI-D CRISPR-associated RNA-guided ribonuclease Cas13d [Bacilli bacterium]